MDIYPDFGRLFELLNEHEVDYMIVGGYALAFHGAPRYTGDIDNGCSIRTTMSGSHVHSMQR